MPHTVVIAGDARILIDDPDYIPAMVMDRVLGGGGLRTRLGQQIRGKRGLPTASTPPSRPGASAASTWCNSPASTTASVGHAHPFGAENVHSVAEKGNRTRPQLLS